MSTLKAESFPTWKTVPGMEIEMVSVSPRDLGFRKDSTFGRFCEVAQEVGFKFCTKKAYGKLFEEAKKTRKDSELWFVMEHNTRAEDAKILYFRDMGRWGGRGVHTLLGTVPPDGRVSLREAFVFTRPKQVA